MAEKGKKSVPFRSGTAFFALLLQNFNQAVEAGKSRTRLCRYFPGLREFVQQASWLSRPSSRWRTEADARAEVQETLQAISELMQ
jgi:hypothetical protein